MENGDDKTSIENASLGNDSGQTPGIIPKTGKRGRPAGSKNRSTPLVTGAPKENRVESRSDNGSDSDSLEAAKFIGVGAVALVELFESMFHSNLAAKVEKKFPSKLEEFKEMAKKHGLQEKEKELTATCIEKIAVRYEVLTKHAPEALLLVTVLQYSARQMHLARFVETVTKTKPIPATVSSSETTPQGN